MRNRGIALAALILHALIPRAHAEPPPLSPTSPIPNFSAESRILRGFDFEETARGNFENTPMFWSKVVGRGFPAFASGRFDHQTFRSANTSFRLDIDSGSAAYQFIAPAGQRIPIDPNADYHIIGFVKTTALAHARAEIAAWFADDQGNLLPQTETHSQPFAAAAATDSPAPLDWHVLHLFIPGPRPGSPEAARAKSLILQLGLLQPQQLAGTGEKANSPLGKFELYQQDLKGTAWFDDITVFQLPRVSIEVPPAVTANIFNPGQPIDLDLTVADLAHTNGTLRRSSLGVALRITDPDGLLFAGEKWAAETAPNLPWVHHYSRPALPPGQYTAALDITDNASGALIARRQTRFLCLASQPVPTNENGTEKTAPEFGLCASDWPASEWNALPAVMRDTNVGLLQLPAWRRDMSEDELRQRDPFFDAMLAATQRADGRIMAAFSELPDVLAVKLSANHAAPQSTDSLLALADADPLLWRSYTSFVLARYSALIDRWEIGSPAAPFSGTLSSPMIASDGPYPVLYQKCVEQLAGLLSQPRVVIPWNALFDFSEKQFPNAILDLRIPSAIKPEQIPSYVRDFQTASIPAPLSLPSTPPRASAAPQSDGLGQIYVHIDALDSSAYSSAERIADFAQRIVYARSTNPTATLIDVPLIHRDSPDTTTRIEPDQLLLVYRTLVRALGNSVYRREIPLGNGEGGGGGWGGGKRHAFLFSRDAQGTLILWNDGAADAPASVDLPLGDSPRAMDIAANVRPLQVNPVTHLTHIVLTSIPILIDHVDSNLVELRASFTLADPILPAGAGIEHTSVLLQNPYNSPFSATIRLVPPPGWTIDPPGFPVSIPPGGTLRQKVTIRYPYTESAGAKTIAGQLTAISNGAGDDASGALNLACDVSIRSDTVETEGFARILPNGDLVIQQMITNIAPYALNTQAYALAPGYARQQRFVVNLPPGQTTIKRFIFPMAGNVNATAKTTPADIVSALTGKSASLGLRQTDGKTLLTKSVPIN